MKKDIFKYWLSIYVAPILVIYYYILFDQQNFDGFDIFTVAFNGSLISVPIAIILTFVFLNKKLIKKLGLKEKRTIERIYIFVLIIRVLLFLPVMTFDYSFSENLYNNLSLFTLSLASTVMFYMPVAVSIVYLTNKKEKPHPKTHLD